MRLQLNVRGGVLKNDSTPMRQEGSVEVPAVCLLCGGPVRPTGHACGDRPELPVGRCENWRVFLERVMDFSHATESYYAADEYFPVDDAAIYAREAPWNAKRIERCVELLPTAASRRCLISAGGIGGFLKRAQPNFASVIGFDLSRRLVEAHRAAGFACVNDLSDVPSGIDTIVLFHVLEHIPRPWLLLSDLLKRFPAVDRVVVEVPHTGEALLSWFNSPPYRLNHHSADHVYYFTLTTLKAVLEKAGLSSWIRSCSATPSEIRSDGCIPGEAAARTAGPYSTRTRSPQRLRGCARQSRRSGFVVHDRRTREVRCVKVLLIGAGRMGMRHLQGLEGVASSCDVVDPRAEAREGARSTQRARRKVRTFANLDALPTDTQYDAAILASTAGGRRRELFRSHRERRHAGDPCRKKPIAQNRADADALLDRVASSNSAVWVQSLSPHAVRLRAAATGRRSVRSLHSLVRRHGPGGQRGSIGSIFAVHLTGAKSGGPSCTARSRTRSSVAAVELFAIMAGGRCPPSPDGSRLMLSCAAGSSAPTMMSIVTPRARLRSSISMMTNRTWHAIPAPQGSTTRPIFTGRITTAKRSRGSRQPILAGLTRD